MHPVKDYVTERLQRAKKAYIDDLEAMSDEQIMNSPGGSARKPVDITYEVILVNKMITKRLKGEEPDAWPSEGWITAPEDFSNKEEIVKQFAASVDEVAAQIESRSEDQMLEPIETPNGPSSALKMGSFSAMHIAYHDGQLNYVQSLSGDMEMHWN